jgi:hypothetical protein
MREPRVIEIVEAYSKDNLKGVVNYLSQPDMRIDPNTWAGQVKKLIEDEYYYSAKLLIETVAYKFTNNIDSEQEK